MIAVDALLVCGRRGIVKSRADYPWDGLISEFEVAIQIVIYFHLLLSSIFLCRITFGADIFPEIIFSLQIFLTISFRLIL